MLPVLEDNPTGIADAPVVKATPPSAVSAMIGNFSFILVSHSLDETHGT